ncbi:unnamed protein product [Chironomus riparius]|uniref:Uncharacterized protein n=1 Tax=Chironomus riparius TaxID=315576 RepID=A0A9N9RM92_9DIPT|nr:unnamed protein product [Chironomus riparius]
MEGKFVILLVITALCVEQCLTSSIPMFEFLSRDEKLSHLYSMFAKQVKDYCKDKHNANASQCKRNMMVYGMDKLNDMEESHLDKMDPYQRDANNILWDSIMENHEEMKSQRHEDQRQAHLQKEQYNQQNPIFKDSYEEVTTDNLNNLASHDHYEEDVQSNYLHQGAASHNNYAYINKPNELDNNEYLEQNSNYLMGGVISWMMPDGSPINGQVPYTLPPDDDMHDMTMGQKKMPSLKDLLDAMTMDEKPKIIMEIPPATTTVLTENPATTSRTLRTLYGNYRVY